MKIDQTFSVISRINQSLLFIGLMSMLGLGLWGAVFIYLDSHKAREGEVTIKSSNEMITVKDYFVSANNQVEQVVFANGEPVGALTGEFLRRA